MAKVTMRPAGVKAAGSTAALAGPPSPKADEVTDARGRVLRIKLPGALDKMRLFGIIGGEKANNQPYLGYAMIAYSVTHINGEPCDKILSPLHIEAQVDRLGDDGIEAVARFMAPQAGEPQNPEA